MAGAHRSTRGQRVRTILRHIWAASFLLLVAAASVASAQEASWIWSPAHEPGHVPHTTCHFRKAFYVRQPEKGTVSIAADDSYVLYVNGRQVASNDTEGDMVEHDITRQLTRGRNLVAVKVANREGSTAGLVARIEVKEKENRVYTFLSDHSWRTNLRPLPLWSTTLYNDSRWQAAKEIGSAPVSEPAEIHPDADAEMVAAEETPSDSSLIHIANEFDVEEVLTAEETGPLNAITFNEFGHILAAQVDGPLLLIFDSDDDDLPDKTRVYCDQVKNCQGVLALNGEVFVTADGPEGAALYRLTDDDRNGTLEKVKTLVKFSGLPGVRGAHGIQLGPDGLLYITVGNDLQLESAADPASPYKHPYEGDLVQPRYEDPHGHAQGRKAPGGFVMRTDIDGESVQLVAGGLRDAFDLAFSRDGELFVHDTHMPTDIGLPWHRPTRLCHITAGSEYGWRSGWAKWPEHYVDSLPSILDTGQGSPTGATFYNHFAFPTRYHNALFLADWSGRILIVKLTEEGGSYAAESKVFLDTNGLHISDLDVGPDGGLYFSTGRFGAKGGIYRVTWQGSTPQSILNVGAGITAAIRQPQLNSAWGRQAIASLMNSVGADWGPQLKGVARSLSNPDYYRTRALDVMQLFGPPPSIELLLQLSRDDEAAVRAKAVDLMGIHVNEKTEQRLAEMLEDDSSRVRRRTCEALLRGSQTVSLKQLQPLLVSKDRFEATAARRLLERLPVGTWRTTVLTTDQHRLFIQGSISLLAAHGDENNARAVLTRFSELIQGFVSDADFIDMLRVAQVACAQGGFNPDKLAELRSQLGEEFPSSHEVMNRELVRLLAYLQVSDPMPRYLAFLKSDASDNEKLHLALHLRYLESGWKEGQRLAVVEFLEQARRDAGAGSAAAYIGNIERDFAKSLSIDEGEQVLARGVEWPSAALGVLYNLPSELPRDSLQALRDLDRKLIGKTDPGALQLRVGIVAVLARSNDPVATAYLRKLWDDEPDRRTTVVMGLAQQPGGANYDYLLRSLPIVEGETAREVLQRLASVERTPDGPEPIRQVILRGLTLEEKGADAAIKLLTRWSGQAVSDESDSTQEQLKAWQNWFAKKYSKWPRAVPPQDPDDAPWKFAVLMNHLKDTHNHAGSAERGAQVFETARCSECHRLGGRGEQVGPELTGITKQYTKREILQSVLYPSHSITEEFQTKTLITTSGRAYTGVVSSDAEGNLTVLQSSGDKVTVQSEHVDDVVATRRSIMPTQLLDSLSIDEVNDLFAYLGLLPPQNVARTPGAATSPR